MVYLLNDTEHPRREGSLQSDEMCVCVCVSRTDVVVCVREAGIGKIISRIFRTLKDKSEYLMYSDTSLSSGE